MSIYKIIRNLSVAVLLTTSISFAMDDEGKNSDDVHNSRLKELPISDGMPLLTFGDMDGLPLLSSGGLDRAALAALFERTSIASSDPVVSTRLAFEETSEQTIARTTVPASFIDTLYENNARERESANIGGIYTQAQVDAMFAKHAASLASYDGLPLLSCRGLDHAALAALFVSSAPEDSAASGDA